MSVNFNEPPEPFDGVPIWELKQIPSASSGASSHWKMQTKQDLLIGKVILGRAIVD